jgi:hypothetical protein
MGVMPVKGPHPEGHYDSERFKEVKEQKIGRREDYHQLPHLTGDAARYNKIDDTNRDKYIYDIQSLAQ